MSVQFLMPFVYTERVYEPNDASERENALAGAKKSLAERGIDVLAQAIPLADHGVDARVVLARGDSRHEYAVLVRTSVTLSDAGRVSAPGLTTLVLTRFVSTRTADAFRRAGVQFLDQVGNAWIEFGDVLIDVRGRPRPKDAQPAVPSTGNLFSTARAQVIFALLTWPRLWDAPHRDLARAAGVSLGQAHNTRALLSKIGYHRDVAKNERTELLDLWAAAFPTGLATKLTRGMFHGALAPVKLADTDDVLYVSGEGAAADLLRPATMTLYVRDFDPRLPIVNRWRSDGPHNITIRHAFWDAPDPDPPGVHPAPWPLVYADLAASDDPRVRDAARTWRLDHARSDASS